MTKHVNASHSTLGLYYYPLNKTAISVTQWVLRQQVRQLSWCAVVVVVSHEPAFLESFAKWSLKGRLMVWATKLIMVSRLALPQLQSLLSDYWTFSMMNAILLNMEGENEHPRYL